MKVITCFSYKGGAGRTVASANIASSLASTKSVAFIEKPLNYKVALIDLDVFSAGLHRVFGISNQEINNLKIIYVQDYLLEQISASIYLKDNAITLSNEIMNQFAAFKGARGNCREDFTLFPAKPAPDRRFIVAKYHENLLYELILELEKEEYDYVLIDGESGTRSMADIALRLSDIVLMFLRLTWQHIDGTLNTAKLYLKKESFPKFYLIPSVVPLIGKEDNIFKDDAPGLSDLRDATCEVPDISGLNEFAEENKGTDCNPGPGYFWLNDMCIHDSLTLKGGERVIVFDSTVETAERAGKDFYKIAKEISRIHPPNESIPQIKVNGEK